MTDSKFFVCKPGISGHTTRQVELQPYNGPAATGVYAENWCFCR